MLQGFEWLPRIQSFNAFSVCREWYVNNYTSITTPLTDHRCAGDALASGLWPHWMYCSTSQRSKIHSSLCTLYLQICWKKWLWRWQPLPHMCECVCVCVCVLIPLTTCCWKESFSDMWSRWFVGYHLAVRSTTLVLIRNLIHFVLN